ncbi:MAG TPA: PA14 domain-containing protein, partial [Verrucomicrobiae bacterium]|nr:PA14 domain-containing protein [Verrucomicrobiae bacterium]
NYTLSGGATVSSAALSADGFSVTLTTSKLNAGTAYTLTVNNVQDIAGNAIAASSQVSLDSWIQVLGTVTVQKYSGINGTTVDTLQGSTNFPGNPDSTFTTNSLIIGSANGLTGWNDSYGDNYGMRITGTLTPPGTGQWNFFIRSDDSSALYLNTSGPAIPDAFATNTPVAYEPGCCNGFLEPGTNTTQTTKTPITLTAGQQYGFTVLLKEGGGGDGVAVGMRIAGDTTPALNVPAIVQYMPKVTAQAPAGVTITTSLSNGQITLTWSGGGVLQSTSQLQGTGTQWTPVAGASSPYTTAASAAAAFYRVQQ